MRFFLLVLLAGLCACTGERGATNAPAGEQLSATAARGQQVFGDEACLQCHSFQGKGGNRGPEVARLVDRNAAPVEVVSSLWNHAPAMWAGMREVGIVKSTMSEERAADMLAYLSRGDGTGPAGDPASGQKVFAEKGCVNCHSPQGGAPVPAKMQRGASPPSMVSVLWEHGPRMMDRMKERNLQWPNLSDSEMADVMAYLGSNR